MMTAGVLARQNEMHLWHPARHCQPVNLTQHARAAVVAHTHTTSESCTARLMWQDKSSKVAAENDDRRWKCEYAVRKVSSDDEAGIAGALPPTSRWNLNPSGWLHWIQTSQIWLPETSKLTECRNSSAVNQQKMMRHLRLLQFSSVQSASLQCIRYCRLIRLLRGAAAKTNFFSHFTDDNRRWRQCVSSRQCCCCSTATTITRSPVKKAPISRRQRW